MNNIGASDPGRTIDWGKTAMDYAKYRPGPPKSYYERLSALGVGLPAQTVLDLATGTGALAVQFAKQGCQVWGIDISADQITMAQTLGLLENVEVRFIHAASEEMSFETHQFDVITANQCFLYFDQKKVNPKIKQFLRPQGLFVTSHFSWLPMEDKIAKASEDLILKHNPSWTGHSFNGDIPHIPYGLDRDFELVNSFYYDEPIRFTRDGWRGRIRACRGIGAALTPEQVQAFDREHEEMLRSMAGESFEILHRIDAHLMRPK